LEAIARGKKVPESEWPKRDFKRGRRTTDEEEERFEYLRTVRDELAEELDLERGFFLPNAKLQRVARDGKEALEEDLLPWQREILEPAVTWEEGHVVTPDEAES
jgi:ribonuclease D